jgi:hypothetical protein
MARQRVFTSKAAKPPATYSQAVKTAGLVFVSGTAPHDPETGAIKGTSIQEQTWQCLSDSKSNSKETLMSNHTELGPDDWDRLIDNPFNIGSFDRSIKAGDWWVITGMHVKLPDALVQRPAGINKLLVFADTISVGISGATQVLFDGWSDVLLIGRSLKQYNDSVFFRNIRDLSIEGTFRIAVFGHTSEHFGPSRGWRIVIPPFSDYIIGATHELKDWRTRILTEIYTDIWTNRRRGIERFPQIAKQLPLTNDGPHIDACRPFLERMLLTAQSLFDAKRTADANHLLDRLETLLAMNPDVVSWHELVPQIPATREMLQPPLPGSDRVPYLSPAVYGDVAEAYGPALKEFANTFQQFVNQAGEIEQRKRAARLILDEKADAIRFQSLVMDQLTRNFNNATNAVSRAQTSLKSQGARVEAADKEFQEGIKAWRRAQEYKAAWAIVGAAFSFASSIAPMFAGNPKGVKDAAEAIAKVPEKAVTLKTRMEQLKKLIEVITRLHKLYKEIAAAVHLPTSKRVADLMNQVRREAEEGLADAPSASAYWDQLWVEVKTALVPAISNNINGAAEYQKQLEVMVIYGRALTAAQAAIPPIEQERAQASLLAELAKRQHTAVAEEVNKLQAQQPASVRAAVRLWLRHHSVQRAMFTALNDFDAAQRYWALKDERPQRNPSSSMTDLADDLLKVADVKASLQRALASFDPPPQDFKRSRFKVPKAACDDLLRDGSFALRFTPDFGPLVGRGDVGRVRVNEVAVWIIWNEGKRPEEGDVEFTIRTDGDYYDQRVESGKVLQFRFLGARVNLTFRYDPVDDSIETPGSVAEDFRAFYTEPTLFTEWQFSLPKGGALNREDFKDAVKGIELQFWGKYIKDADRLVDDEEMIGG